MYHTQISPAGSCWHLGMQQAVQTYHTSPSDMEVGLLVWSLECNSWRAMSFSNT